MVLSGKKVLLAAAVLASLGSAAAQAASFTQGDLLVYRVGNGIAQLGNASTNAFVDEYTTAGVLVQSINISAASQPLTAAGNATSEGFLSLSTDGQYLVLPGYNVAAGVTGIGASANTVASRVVAAISVSNFNVTGAATTAETLSAFSQYQTLGTYGGGNIRSVASNGTNFWAGTSTGGIFEGSLTTGGATAIAATTLTPPSATNNVRTVEIAGGQLYTSSSSPAAPATTVRIATVGTGLPTSGGQTFTNLPGLNSTTGSQYAYYFADLSSTVAGLDTLYVADDSAATVATAGITKYTLSSSGTWAATGTLTAPLVRGLTGVTNADGSVSLYGTTGGTATTATVGIYNFTDPTGYNGALSGTASNLVTLSNGTNGNTEAFRGIAYVPVTGGSAIPEPASLGLLAVGALSLVARRRRA